MTNELTSKLLRLFATHNCCGKLHWDINLTFYVSCNDLFFRDYCDSQEIATDDDILLLTKCLKQSQHHAIPLYCARKRGMRPRGECYEKLFFTELAVEALFDACGPYQSPAERENQRKRYDQ